MQSANSKLLCLLCLLAISPSAAAETRFALPRAVHGLELLLGIGPSYDKTAFIGEETETALSPAIALLTENFYLDIHEISYRRSVAENVNFRIFGTQDGLPSEEDGIDILSIKSGDSFDLGIQGEKDMGLIRLAALAAADITGTHNGYKVEFTVGKDLEYTRSKIGVTFGGRYTDSKRSNYYFGVAQDEALSDVPEYRTDADTVAFANATMAYQFTHNIGVLMEIGIESISDQARNSPRVDSNASVGEVEVFAGLIWQFSVYKSKVH